MKKLLLLTVTLLFTLTLAAQDVIVIQTNAVQSAYYNEYTEEWSEWSEWEDCKLLISINIKESLIRIDNTFEDSFKLLKTIKQEKGIDPYDGDPWKELYFSAVDKEGSKCTVAIRDYNSGVHLVSVSYTNISYVYEGRTINF